jgi:hypothetical protein
VAVLPFGPWAPDISDLQGQNSQTIHNVYPRGDGYGPVADALAYTSALAAACRGFFYAKKSDGSVQVFAGTSDKLYSLNNTTQAWADVSKALGTYSALSSNAQWQFRQFNNFVIAVQANAPTQVYDLTSSTEFADLGGSPPQAAYISIVNRFVVLSGLASPNVYRVQWSGLNATTTWTSGVSQSDYQDLADGGIVRGVAGGEFGVIFQDSSIRRMTYAPGAPYIFGIDRVSSDDGLFAPYSLINAQDRIFFLSPQGFKMLLPGGYPQPIGKERVDRTFFADLDESNIQLMIGASDPRSTRVYWAYKSVNGATGRFDKILCYDWALDKWTPITMSGEYLASLSRPGITLEGVDAAYGADIDALSLSSLDDISNAAFAQASTVDTLHKLAFFTGANLEATLETPEQGNPGGRIRVQGFSPVSDAPVVYGSVTHRATAQASATTNSETLVNADGVCPQNISTRFARGKIRITAGSTWTYATGIEPYFENEGRR